MLRRVTSGIALGITFLAGLVIGPREAGACSPPPDGWYFTYQAGATPANGALVMHYACYMACETEPDPETFRLKTPMGEPVAGSVVLTGTKDSLRFIVFRPESALIAGDTYSVELEGLMPFTYVSVGPEITWKTDFTLTDEFIGIDQPHGESICCTGPIDSCGGTPCFRTEIDRKIGVHVSWDDGQTAESAQYAYRILLDGDEDDVAWSWNGASAGFEPDAAQTSVCYVLELQRLSDGFVHRFEERCLERPEDLDPGIYPAPDQDIAAVLASCDAPPEGYEGPWCSVRADLCTPSEDPWCENYVEICLDDGEGGASSGGTSGSAGSSSGSGGRGGSGAGTGGSSGGTHAGTGGSGEAGGPDRGNAGDTGDGSDDGERVYTKGCGCAVPGSRRNNGLDWALGAFGLAASALRRKRSRAR